MAKKVIDRILKTFMIVIDILYGVVITFYGVVCLFMSSYTVEDSLLQTAVSVGAMIVANVINVIVRRWIKNY